MRFRFTYDGYQTAFIEIVKDTNVVHRIKKDKTIEFAQKWETTVDDLLIDFRFELFDEPVIHHLDKDFPYLDYIHKLAEKNIPFVTEKWNEEYRIVTDSSDTMLTIEVLRELEIFPWGS